MPVIQRFRSFLTVLMAAIIIAGMCGTSISAQEKTPIPPDSLQTISVSGTGVVSATPDTASVMFGIRSTDASLEKAQDDVTDNLTEVTNAVTNAGIASDDVKTSQYNVRPINEYDRNDNFRGIRGYEVSVALDITVHDIDALGELLDAATGAGANYISGVSLYVEDTAKPANQARDAAMKDARSRAEAYALSEGLLITGVYSIEETAAPQPKALRMEESNADYQTETAADSGANPVPINPGSSEIRVDVQVVYIMEQGNG